MTNFMESVDEWVKTLDQSKGYWDGVLCSEAAMGKSFVERF